MRIYKEWADLSQYERQQGDFKTLWPIVQEAINKKVWLYNKLTREWFTPDEFLAAYRKKEMNNYEVKTLKTNVIPRDPRDGNSAYHKEIERCTEKYHQDIIELRQKGEAFLNKVIAYYKEYKS